MRRNAVLAAGATALLAASITVAPVSAKQVPSVNPGPTVIATGLLNPRGLDFGPNGTLYVAEAGTGGATPISPPGPNQQFIGTTSQISAIDIGGAPGSNVHPVVAGLISVANADGTFATGADGLSVQGGRILAIMTGAHQLTDGVPPGAVPLDVLNAAKAQLGRLIKLNPGGHWTTIGDVGGFDFNYTLTCGAACDNNIQFPDANPYGVLGLPGMTYVADAGANTLDLVSANGSVQILAYVHAQSNDFLGDEVPTCVAQAGGQLYIGTLNGNVFRYDGTPTLQRVTLTTPPGPPLVSIGGCTGDAVGNLYLSDQFGGAVWKVAPGGATTKIGDVPDPSGIVLGPDGYLYVSQNSTQTNGQVVRLHP
jgi:hypothetical protein